VFGSLFRSGLRSLARQKPQAVINILGFTVGLACCFLMYAYVARELSYDGFHENKASLYRITIASHQSDGSVSERSHRLPPALDDELTDFFPQIDAYSRYHYGVGTVRVDNETFREWVDLGDPSFLNMFTFPLIQGDKETALSEKGGVLLSRSYAIKFFETESALGKRLSISFANGERDFVVTGVVEDPPENSTIRFNILVDYAHLPLVRGEPGILQSWKHSITSLFVRLRDDAVLEEIETRMDDFYDTHCRNMEEVSQGSSISSAGHPRYSLGFQNVADMHFDPALGGVDPLRYYILLSICGVILLIVAVNATNIAISTASRRSVEVGIRKSNGASPRQLVVQFLSESLIVSLISIILAADLAFVALPAFEDMLGTSFQLADVFSVQNILALLATALLMGTLTGLYPSMMLARLRISSILQGRLDFRRRGALSITLLGLQFVLSIVLLVSVLVLSSQLRFINDKPLGYDHEGLLTIGLPGDKGRTLTRFRERAASHSDVYGITGCSSPFGSGVASNGVVKNGSKVNVYKYKVDQDFITTMRLNLIEGRDFSREFGSDSLGVIVNQSLVRALHIDDPVGNTIGGTPAHKFPNNLTILGVVSDFHFQSLHSPIRPVILHMYPDPRYDRINSIVIRISSDDPNRTIKFLASVWAEISPTEPFRYSFVADNLERHYRDEQRWSSITWYASGTAILMTCMGLFGMISITVVSRSREMAIRRMLGAGAGSLWFLLNRQYIWLIGVSSLLAWPVAYILMQRWLGNYAFRIALNLWLFLVPSLAVFVIATVTMGGYTLRAALARPIAFLRNE